MRRAASGSGTPSSFDLGYRKLIYMPEETYMRMLRDVEGGSGGSGGGDGGAADRSVHVQINTGEGTEQYGASGGSKNPPRRRYSPRDYQQQRGGRGRRGARRGTGAPSAAAMRDLDESDGPPDSNDSTAGEPRLPELPQDSRAPEATPPPSVGRPPSPHTPLPERALSDSDRGLLGEDLFDYQPPPPPPPPPPQSNSLTDTAVKELSQPMAWGNGEQRREQEMFQPPPHRSRSISPLSVIGDDAQLLFGLRDRHLRPSWKKHGSTQTAAIDQADMGMQTDDIDRAHQQTQTDSFSAFAGRGTKRKRSRSDKGKKEDIIPMDRPPTAPPPPPPAAIVPPTARPLASLLERAQQELNAHRDLRRLLLSARRGRLRGFATPPLPPMSDRIVEIPNTPPPPPPPRPASLPAPPRVPALLPPPATPQQPPSLPALPAPASTPPSSAPRAPSVAERDHGLQYYRSKYRSRSRSRSPSRTDELRRREKLAPPAAPKVPPSPVRSPPPPPLAPPLSPPPPGQQLPEAEGGVLDAARRELEGTGRSGGRPYTPASGGKAKKTKARHRNAVFAIPKKPVRVPAKITDRVRNRNQSIPAPHLDAATNISFGKLDSGTYAGIQGEDADMIRQALLELDYDEQMSSVERRHAKREGRARRREFKHGPEERRSRLDKFRDMQTVRARAGREKQLEERRRRDRERREEREERTGSRVPLPPPPPPAPPNTPTTGSKGRERKRARSVQHKRRVIDLPKRARSLGPSSTPIARLPTPSPPASSRKRGKKGKRKADNTNDWWPGERRRFGVPVAKKTSAPPPRRNKATVEKRKAEDSISTQKEKKVSTQK